MLNASRKNISIKKIKRTYSCSYCRGRGVSLSPRGSDRTVRLWSPCDRWDRFMQISEEDGGFYYRRRWSQRAVGGRQSREQAPSVGYRSGFSRSDVQYDFRGNQRRKLIRKVCDFFVVVRFFKFRLHISARSTFARQLWFRV